MQNITTIDRGGLLAGDTRWNYLRGFADIKSSMRAARRFPTAARMRRFYPVPRIPALKRESDYGIEAPDERAPVQPDPKGIPEAIDPAGELPQPEPRRRTVRANESSRGRSFDFIDVVRHKDVRLRLSPGKAVELPRIHSNTCGRIVFSGEADLQSVMPSEFTDAWCRAIDRRVRAPRSFSVLDAEGSRAEGFRRSRDALRESWSLSALVPPFRLETEARIGKMNSTEDENILHFQDLFRGLAEMRLALTLKSILAERSQEGKDDRLSATREAVRWALGGEISSASLSTKAVREWRLEKGVYLRGTGRHGLLVAKTDNGWIMRATEFSKRGNPVPLPRIWIRDPIITAFTAEFLDRDAAFDIEDEACASALESVAEELSDSWQWRSKSAMVVAQAAAHRLSERWRFTRRDIEAVAEWLGRRFRHLIPPSEGVS